MDLSTNDARIALAGKYAAKYGLDPYLVCAVCEQESAWNTWAVRYEPNFFSRYMLPLLSAGTLEIGEANARAFSYGLMQLMGQTAREFGFGGRFLTELCDPDIGVDFGCRKLQKCFSVHGEPETSLLAYNGGGNAYYGQQVLARVAHYLPQAGAD